MVAGHQIAWKSKQIISISGRNKCSIQMFFIDSLEFDER